MLSRHSPLLNFRDNDGSPAGSNLLSRRVGGGGSPSPTSPNKSKATMLRISTNHSPMNMHSPVNIHSASASALPPLGSYERLSGRSSGSSPIEGLDMLEEST